MSDSPLFVPLLISGVDARQYLQGQLTCDLNTLTSDNALLACCNSPQGRVQAVFTLIERPEGIVLLVLPEIADSAIVRLRKYLLRAKAVVENASSRWRVSPLWRSELAHTNDATLSAPGIHRAVGDHSLLRWHDIQHERYLSLTDSAFVNPTSMTVDDWRLADIRVGLPQVYPAAQETFIAQMLNLDLLGGISFDKGCYTGQEIIARAHFRGAVKRRMFRFAANCAPPMPGTRITVNGEHAGDVVIAAAVEQGCELLAVVNLAQLDSALILSAAGAPLQRLPLPYSIQS